jgi:hypothetical protein
MKNHFSKKLAIICEKWDNIFKFNNRSEIMLTIALNIDFGSDYVPIFKNKWMVENLINSRPRYFPLFTNPSLTNIQTEKSSILGTQFQNVQLYSTFIYNFRDFSEINPETVSLSALIATPNVNRFFFIY